MDEKQRLKFLEWISGGKELFAIKPEGYIQFIKHDVSEHFLRLSDSKVFNYDQMKEFERKAVAAGQHFMASYRQDIDFPGSNGEDIFGHSYDS